MKSLGTQSIEIDRIDVGQRLRAVDDAHVQFLMAQISELGVLLNPLTLIARKDGRYRLSAGGHRLEAVKRLGWKRVSGNVHEASADEALLAEIDENLRHELNPLDRAVTLAKRKEIYERLHPDAKRGVAGAKARVKGATEIISFAADTAARVGLTDRAIRLAVMIAERLDAGVRARIAGTEVARHQACLLALAKLPAEQQRRALKGHGDQPPTVKSMKAAIAKASGRKPKAKPSWRDRFATLVTRASAADRAWAARFLADLDADVDGRRKPKLRVVA